MKKCKQTCQYQHNGMCTKESIPPHPIKAFCPHTVKISEHRFNGFADIFNGNYFD